MTPRSIRGAASALVFASAIAAGGTAHAQASERDRQLAADHVRIGVADFAQRHFHHALQEFQSAYELNHDPMLLSNIGIAQSEDGDLQGARTSFREYLARVPNAPNRAAIEARLRDLDARLPATGGSSDGHAPASPSPGGDVPRTPTPGLGGVRIAGLVVGGVGLVGAVAGVGLWASVDATFHRCQAALPQGCSVDAQPQGLDVGSVAMMWGGAALAVTGTLMFLLGPRPAPATTPRDAHGRRPVVTTFAFDPSRGMVLLGGEL